MNYSNPNLPSSFLVVLGFLGLLILPFDQLFSGFQLGEFQTHHAGDILKNLIITLYGLLLIRHYGYIRLAGVFRWTPRRPILLIVPLYFVIFGLLPYFFLDYDFTEVKRQDLLLLFAAMLSVGISEEVVFRGFVLPHLIKKSPTHQGLIIPIITAALLFGVLHFLNLLQPDASGVVVISQVTYATMFGVAFGIILLRTESLLPLGILHGLINFSSNFDQLPGALAPIKTETYLLFEAAISVLIVLPFLWYTLRQFPKIDQEAIFNRYQDLEK
ncbi:MAG: CPBP family intramembrane metalloprotease [Saprospiraceae bacterium]|nr:CPBP family intramembrane metalloprotease [Saprospiraceae bacterium]